MGRKKRTKIIIVIFAAVIVCAALAVGGIMIYGKYQISKIPGLTFTEALEYTTEDNAGAVITVGMIKDKQISYKVYGENGKELPAKPHTYEIGSLTKTFTAALVNKAISEGKLRIDDTIDNLLPQNELGLTETGISGKSGNLDNYWDWKANDAYLPAGAITSNITDMLSYAQIQLEGNPYFYECHKSIKAINASTEDYRTMGINMDEIGMSWMIDRVNGIIWHNGGKGHYNSYLGFNPETGTAVVVLSNLAPDCRIPATVLGTKLLIEMEN